MSREIWIKHNESNYLLYIGIYRGNDYAEIRKDNPDLVAKFFLGKIFSSFDMINEETALHLIDKEGYKEFTGE